MNDNQRLLLAFGLTLLIFGGYQALFAPPPAQTEPAAAGAPAAESAADAAGEAAVPALPSAPPAAPAAVAAAAPVAAEERPATAQPLQAYALSTSDAEFTVRGAAVTRWLLPAHGREPGEGAPRVDLCEGLGDTPCLRFGFGDRGAPDRVEPLGTPVRAVRAVWLDGDARFVATLRPLGDHQIGLSFSLEGDTAGRQAQPWAELGAALDDAVSDYVFRGLRFRRAGAVESIAPDELGRHGWDGRFDWLMWDDKYFGRAFLTGDLDVKVAVTAEVPKKGVGPGVLRVEAPRLVGRGDDVPAVELRVFGGPKEIGLLKRIGRSLQESIDFGMTGMIGRPILSLLHLFDNLTGNYGWAIVLLTIAIKFALYPLTASSMRSMHAMAKLRPRMQELQAKHKGDPARLNQEMMALYRSEKVNPLGGCLPMLLQIPIFFALYRVLLVSIELRHAPFMFWINDLAGPELLATLSFAGFDLPIRIMPLVMGATMFLQQKLTPTAVADPIQQKVFMLMPILFTFLFYGFPAGLVLYWLTNNVVSIGQQWWIQRGAERSATA